MDTAYLQTRRAVIYEKGGRVRREDSAPPDSSPSLTLKEEEEKDKRGRKEGTEGGMEGRKEDVYRPVILVVFYLTAYVFRDDNGFDDDDDDYVDYDEKKDFY